MRKPYWYIKYVLDIVLALVLLLPALAAVSLCFILIKMETKGPAFFVQERPGYKGKLFKIYKLRTMVEQTQWDGKALSDMERMTRTGRVIRALSLDELPQLLNILKGEMSFIGPRPLAVEYLPYYTEEEYTRHDVKPGISGLAQVNGRNNLSWDQKFAFDIKYVREISFFLDLRIIFLTIKKVLVREGIGQAEEAPVSLHIERGTRMEHKQ